MSAEHDWVDRLAIGMTRRDGLRAALAGLLFAAFPTRLAFAENPNSSDEDACRTGCLYSSHRVYYDRANACSDDADVRFRIYGAGALLGASSIGILTGALVNTAGFFVCLDLAVLRHKARNYDCLQPNCPGFDPAGEYGPCKNCATIKGCLCCPDAASATGYTYCDNSVGYCCSPAGGCRACDK